MKIEMEVDDMWPIGLVSLVTGFFIGAVLVLLVYNDAHVDYNYKRYKTEHPSSTITYEDYKRLKG